MSKTTTAAQYQSQRVVLSLLDLIDRILDKGLIIDVNLSISLVGIEILVVRARIVVSGIDAFLRYGAAMGLTGPLGVPVEA